MRIRRHFMHLPVVRGTIARRLLVNFRCDPDVLARLLPSPFRPRLVAGWGMAGICLIRLENICPSFLPALVGFCSENAAHRIAVEWNKDGCPSEGVFIPRRDTDSRLNEFAGGRIFSGVHHRACFSVFETTEAFTVKMQSADGATFVKIQAHVAAALPPDSVFQSLDEASNFFQGGALGWSARPKGDEFDGLELRCREWRMTPLEVSGVESSFFADQDLFPCGSAEFDSAFLMRDIAHEWHDRGRLAPVGLEES